jgi:hypothetical protein
MATSVDDRCDVANTTGGRCRCKAKYWVRCPDPLSPEGFWPIAVCQAHYKDGEIRRAGPDRRAEYTAWQQAHHSDDPTIQT